MRHWKSATIIALAAGVLLIAAPQGAMGEETADATAGSPVPATTSPDEATASDSATGDTQGTAPHAITEVTGAYIFLVWWWIVTLTLLYALRQKVREADALHRMGFFGAQRD